jgi:hypothetical protein
MSMIGFPLLLIPLTIVNILVFLMPGVSLTAPVAALPLLSGVSWTFTLGDILLALGMLLLILEMAKAARPGTKYFTDHLLSLLLLAGASAEFVLLPQFGTSTFFLLTVLAFVDFVASIAIRARRPRPPRDAVIVPATVAPSEPHVDPLQPPAAAPISPADPVPPVDASPARTAPEVIEPHGGSLGRSLGSPHDDPAPAVTVASDRIHGTDIKHDEAAIAPLPDAAAPEPGIIPRR